MPDFSANTTHGPIEFYDYAGDSWVVLFSHPADFTPVCTTELGRMAARYSEFKRQNVKLLALSCDPLQTHADWVNDIKSYYTDIPADFPYPIICDESRELAVRLDMLNETDRQDPETAVTVRALYIIDPNKKLRLSMLYPTTIGRNIDEILRVITALQLHDRLKVIATPVDWTPGEKIMILPEATNEVIGEIFPSSSIHSVSMPSGKDYLRTATKY